MDHEQSTVGGQRAGTITMSGRGETRVTPDQAVLGVGVTCAARDVSPALQQLTDGTRRALTVLRDAGVPEASIGTSSVSIHQQYGDRGQLTGYEASQQLEVRLADLSQAGVLLPLLADAVGNALRINQLQAISSDTSEAERASRALAFDAARAKAEQLAHQAGRTLGRVVNVTESGVDAPPAFAVRSAMAYAGALETPAGEQTVAASVTVTWALAD